MFQKFNLAECVAYLQYKHHEKNVSMPKLVGKRRKRCIKVMKHKSPTSSPHANDAEDDGAGDSSPDLDVIDALMGLSLSTIDVSVYEYAL